MNRISNTIIICVGLISTPATVAASSAGFVAAAPLITPRAGHTATLLRNGKVLVVGPGASTELYDPASNTWTQGGSLAIGRANHTTTLLPSGKVLVAGGFGDGNIILNEAELYDPASNTWSDAGTFQYPRFGHKATLLANGKVLIAGGYHADQGMPDFIVQTQLYDPDTNTWSGGGSLANSRHEGHTELLLSNGKVLLAGGKGRTKFLGLTIFLGSVEVYDGTSNTWRSVASMAGVRTGHTATLLPNGKVLVVGGGNGTATLKETELYDAGTEMWSAGPSLATPRSGHTATLLPDGSVLVAGGEGSGGAELYDAQSNTWSNTASLITARSGHTATLLPNGKVLIVGGIHNNTLSSVELFDPSTSAKNLVTPRDDHSATLLQSGQVLVVGGRDDGNNHRISTTELYSPDTNTFTAAGNLKSGSARHTATLLPTGRVLVVGGYADNDAQGHPVVYSRAELYIPETKSWIINSNLITKRAMHTATLLPSGKVLVVGGITYNASNLFGAPLNSAELYDPVTGSWTAAASLASTQVGHSATLLPNGKILVAGGGNAELYDEASNTWTAAASPANYHGGQTATLLPNGRVLIADGSPEIYNPVSNTWAAAAGLTAPRNDHTATLLPSGRVLVAGGTTLGAGTTLKSTEIYDPETNTWSASEDLDVARSNHTATLLSSGKALIAGGYLNFQPVPTACVTEKTMALKDAWRPVIGNATSPLSLGSALKLTGTQFKGISESSSGRTSSSATNYPIVQLRSLGNEQTAALLPDPGSPWSNTSFTSLGIPSTFPVGYAAVTVTTNGIPSIEAIVQIIKISLAPTATTLPNAKIGVPYNQTFTAGSNTSNYTYTFSSNPGALPAGLTLSPSGLLSGTPTQAGAFNIVVTARDNTVAGSVTGSQSYSLTVMPPTILFSPLNLLNANAGEPYSRTLECSGGTPPYSFSITAGTPPAGITLSSTGLLSGTSTENITANFIVTATDSSTGTGPFTGSQSYSLTVVSGGGTPPTAVAHAYSVNENEVLTIPQPGVLQDAIDQGNLPLTAVLSGPQPAHGTLALNTDGSFTYTPNLFFNGTDTFKYQASNGTLVSTPQTVTITVNFVNQPPSFAVPANALSVRADAGPQTVPGCATNISTGAPNETAQTLTFAVANNSNPSLFTVPPALSSNGTLTYTPDPNASGQAAISVVLKDSGGTANGGNDTSVPRAFTITINPAPPLLPDSLTASGMVAAQFSYTLNASGGRPIVFSATTQLPPGLALNGNTITGAPSLDGSFSTTVTASNTTGPTDTKPLGIVIVKTLIISTVAGTAPGTASGDGGPATAAALKGPLGVTASSSGNIYIADTENSRVRKVDPAGTITTVAGGGTQSGDGILATSAQLAGPSALALDSAENLFICETTANRIRKVDAVTGVISTIVAAGPLNNPSGITVDGAGNIFIADKGNHCVRRIDSTGTMTVYAGLGNVAGSAADGGPATAAQLSVPFGVATDVAGNLFIADQGHQVIRAVSTDGIITTLAGTYGVAGFAGDGGPATKALLNNPLAVAVDAAGNVYVADSSNNRVRKVLDDGIIVTLGGASGLGGLSGDGTPAVGARLNGPAAVAMAGADGSILVADRGNSRIRRLSPPGKPVITSGPTATNNPTNFKSPVIFACTATSSSPVVWVWDFGDGTQDSSNTSSPTHAFPGPGIYTVTATATDQTGSSVSASIEVNTTLLGTIVPVEIMKELGLDAYDPAASPLGADELAKLQDAGVVKISSIKLNYKTDGKDSLALTASTILKAPSNPNGQQLVLDLGGIVKVFTVTAKGRGYTVSDGSRTDKLTVSFKSGTMNIKAQFKNGKFAGTLQKINGFGENDRVKPSIDFNMLYGGHLYQKLKMSVNYKVNAKAHTGAGKTQ